MTPWQLIDGSKAWPSIPPVEFLRGVLILLDGCIASSADPTQRQRYEAQRDRAAKRLAELEAAGGAA